MDKHDDGNQLHHRFQETYDNYKKLVEDALPDSLLPVDPHAALLYEAMHYSLTSGGKRLRPVLLMAAAESGGAEARDVLGFACALEQIHTYSLIHDDHPSMDDDDLRRGKPTNHKLFGDDLAILAGDGLLNNAAELLLREAEEGGEPRHLRAAREILKAAGTGGMIAGQTADVIMTGSAAVPGQNFTQEFVTPSDAPDSDAAGMNDRRTADSPIETPVHENNGRIIDVTDPTNPADHPDPASIRRRQAARDSREGWLTYIHRNKTGALIRASVRAGAILGGASEERLHWLTVYAEALGLAFQIIDDLLDLTGDEAQTGKETGRDQALGKLTFPACFGIAASQEKARKATEEAIDALHRAGGRTDFLEELAISLLNRVS